MKRLLRSSSFAFACASTLCADVQYDMTFRTGTLVNIAPSVPVAGAPVAVNDIPSDQYIPSSLKNERQSISHIRLKGDRLVVIGPQADRTIYDLANKTVTLIDDRKKSFTVQTFDEIMNSPASRNLRLVPYGLPPVDKTMVRDTGKTTQLVGGQTAKRFDIISIQTGSGRPRVDGSMVCWVADHSPSAELDRFHEKWQAATRLPFPDGTSGALDSWISSSALAKTRDTFLVGRVLDLVYESRPYLAPEWNPNHVNSDNGRYDASATVIQDGSPRRPNAEFPAAASSSDFGFPARHDFWSYEIALSNFTMDAVPDIAFDIPSNYKRKVPKQ